MKELANLGATRQITTSLAGDARGATDRIARGKAQASLAHEKGRQRAFATWREAETASEVIAEREQLDRLHSRQMNCPRGNDYSNCVNNGSFTLKATGAVRVDHVWFFQESSRNEEL